MVETTISSGSRRLATPAPVRFVHNGRVGAQAAVEAADFEALLAREPEVLRAFSENGDLCWTVQTFCRLREAGFGGIELSTEAAPGRINLSKAKTLSRRGWTPGIFDVSIQADYPRVAWARFHLQQNRDLLGHDAHVVPLWPQARIIPRDAGRSGISRIGFFGKIDGNLAGGDETWRALLAERGLEFCAPQADRWHDFSMIDVAIGIRSFDFRRHSRKPANKLINAWMAGVPFIGGHDSAFVQIGKPGENYLQAATPGEVIEQIGRLQADPRLYDQLVRAGAAEAEAFTVPGIADHWVGILEGPISARYLEWEAHAASEKVRSGLLSLAQGGVDLAKAAARKLLRREYEA